MTAEDFLRKKDVGEEYIPWIALRMEDYAKYLLTKEKEQREELIKKAFTDGAEWELYGSDLTQEERAEQYYNEVIKTKHLNK